MKNIYIYTFPSNYYEIENNGKFKLNDEGKAIPKKRPLVKVGETVRNVDTRINEQMSASNNESPIKLYELNNVSFSDKDVHKLLNTHSEIYHHTDGKGTEWFEGSLDDIKGCIHQLAYGSNRPNSYPMRTEQETAVNKTSSYFQTGGDTFLWNAKMRFGKTFTTYQLVKRINANKVLVLTYKPDVRSGWENELNNHIDFDGYEFVSAIDHDTNNPIDFDKHDKSIVFASFQDVLQQYTRDEEDEYNDSDVIDFTLKPKFQELFSTQFDLVVIDEVHYGASTNNAKTFMSYLKYDKLLYLSGTPIKLLNSGDFDADQIYQWTYIDEQKAKQNEIDTIGIDNAKQNKYGYYWLPSMKIFTYKVSDEGVSACKDYSDEEGFTANKFFGATKEIDKNSKRDNIVSTFRNHTYVKNFLDIITNKENKVYPFHNNKVKHLEHSLWLLPDVASCESMADMLMKHKFFKQHKIVCVAGNNLSEGNNALSLVENAIKECTVSNSKYSKSITLSCGKLTTGVTIPKWDSVFMFDGTTSTEKYFQTIFRGQSTNFADKKEECYVFDFNPTRTLSLIYDYAKNSDKESNRSVQEKTKEFLDVVNILNYEDNEWVEIDVSDIMDIGTCGFSRQSISKNFRSNKLLNINSNTISLLDNLSPELQSIFDKLKERNFRKSNYSDTENNRDINSIIKLTDNEITKGKNTKTSNDESESTKKTNEEKQIENKRAKYILALKRIYESFPLFMYLSEYREHSLYDVQNTKDDDILETSLGITLTEFNILNDAGFFNAEYVDNTISKFNIYEDKDISF